MQKPENILKISNVPQFWQKTIFWLVVGISSILAVNFLITRPDQTLLLVGLALISLSIAKNLKFGLYIIIFLPVIGELYRLPFGPENGLLLSDFFIPITVGIWILLKLLHNPHHPAPSAIKIDRPRPWTINTPESTTFYHAAIPLAFTFFIIVATLSLLQSLLFLTPKETLSGSLYLVRYLFYGLLFFVTIHATNSDGRCSTRIHATSNDNRYSTRPHITSNDSRYPTRTLATSSNNHPVTAHTTPTQNFKKILTAISISALLLAIAGFIQLVIYPDLAQLEKAGWDPHINRLVSTWLDPNFVGGLLSFISCILIGITLHLKKFSQKIGLSTIILILLIAIFLTYSRSAYLALAAGLTVISLLKSRKILIIALILATLGLTVSDRARERTAELFQSVTAIFTETAQTPDPTAKLRLKSYDQTIQLIQKRPLLGSGYNTLRDVNHHEGFISDPEIHSAGGSDSSLLTILATTGILGFIPFALIYLAALLVTWNNWRRPAKNTPPERSFPAHKSPDKTIEPITSSPTSNTITPLFRGYNLGLFGGICALLIHSLFVNSLLFPPILIYFWICLGLAVHKKT